MNSAAPRMITPCGSGPLLLPIASSSGKRMNSSQTVEAVIRTALLRRGLSHRPIVGVLSPRRPANVIRPSSLTASSSRHLTLRLAQEPQHEEHADRCPDREYAEILSVEARAYRVRIERVLKAVGQRPDREDLRDVDDTRRQRVG